MSYEYFAYTITYNFAFAAFVSLLAFTLAAFATAEAIAVVDLTGEN